jgi:hypothetical protein
MSHPDSLYDDYNDFYSEDAELNDYEDDFDDFDDYYDESMDGDHDSAMTSAGWGTDEDYGYYGDDREDFHSDEAVGFVDYNEDGPYDD